MPQSDAKGEVYTTIPTEMALRQSEITAMRMLGDQMANLANRLQEVGIDLKDVRERLITLEAGKFEAKLLEQKLDFEKELLRLEKENTKAHDDKESRMRIVERYVTRLSGALAIISVLGGSALGIIMTKVFA